MTVSASASGGRMVWRCDQRCQTRSTSDARERWIVHESRRLFADVRRVAKITKPSVNAKRRQKDQGSGIPTHSAHWWRF
jgi:hypothetical protein